MLIRPLLCMSVSVCDQQRADEEVVVDQGGTSSVMNIHYEKEELEGELSSVLNSQVSAVGERSINDVL